MPENTQRTLLDVSLHAIIALAGITQLRLKLGSLLGQALLVSLELDSLLLELLLYVHDLFLLARQLTAYLHDLTLELLLKLDDPLFPSLQIRGLLPYLAFQRGHLLNGLIEELLTLSLSHLPVTSDLLDLLDLFLLQVRQKLGHFRPFPHL